MVDVATGLRVRQLACHLSVPVVKNGKMTALGLGTPEPAPLILELVAALLLCSIVALPATAATADSPPQPPASAVLPAASPPPPAAATAMAGPRLEVDLGVRDLGTIIAGASVKHEFRLTNGGTETLEITNVIPTCDCTIVGSFPSRLEPGQAGAVVIQFKPADYSGEVRKSVRITCNDPVHPIKALLFKANVWRPVEVKPAVAVFEPVAGSPTGQVQVVRIVNRLKEPLVLSAPVCTNNFFQVELKTIRDGQEFDLIIKTLPGLQPGIFLAPVTVAMISTNLPPVSVNAYAIVRAPPPPTAAADPKRVKKQIPATH